MRELRAFITSKEGTRKEKISETPEKKSKKEDGDQKGSRWKSSWGGNRWGSPSTLKKEKRT